MKKQLILITGIIIAISQFMSSCDDLNCRNEQNAVSKYESQLNAKRAEIEKLSIQSQSAFENNDIYQITLLSDEMGDLIFDIAMLEIEIEEYKKSHCDCF